jgi:predicted DNA-binding protein
MMADPQQLSFWPRRRRFTDRVELRLDNERRQRLTEIAEARGVPRSQVVRELIDEAYERSVQRMRLSS